MMKFNKNLKIFPKVLLYTFFTITLLLVLSYGLLLSLLPKYYNQSKHNELRLKTDGLVNVLQFQTESEILDTVNQFASVNNLNLKLNDGVQDYDFYNFSVVEIAYNENYFDALFNHNVMVNFDDDYSDQQVIMQKRIFTNGLGQSYTVQAMMSIHSIEESKQIIISLSPLILSISLIVSFFAAFLFSKGMTSPIKKMADTTQKMRQLEPDIKYEISSHDEMGQLADDINGLYTSLLNTIESLQESLSYTNQMEKERNDFIIMMSHELKTPLTALMILLENMHNNVGKYKDHDFYLAESMDKVTSLSETITSILNLTKEQTVLSSQDKEDINVSLLLHDLIEKYDVMIMSSKLRIIVDIEDDVYLKINANAIEMALSNVLSNAIQYTPYACEVVIHLDSKSLIIENDVEQEFNHQETALFEKTGLGFYIIDDVFKRNQLNYSFINTGSTAKFELFL